MRRPSYGGWTTRLAIGIGYVVVTYNHKETEHNKAPSYGCGDLVTDLPDKQKGFSR